MRDTKYIGTAEIMARLPVGKTKATEILHLFAERGQLFRVGRVMMIPEKVFEDWLRHECRVEVR